MVGGKEEKEEGKGRGDLRGRVEFGTPRKGERERERETRSVSSQPENSWSIFVWTVGNLIRVT